jgi:4-amino-4-deoxy-L-arabinose transferase-like glycosyltransferase
MGTNPRIVAPREAGRNELAPIGVGLAGPAELQSVPGGEPACSTNASPPVAPGNGKPYPNPRPEIANRKCVPRTGGSRAVTRFVVVSLLTIHAGLLAWQAYRYSPTIDEPAHMAAGISHWKFGRFDLYRVNPPLVRMIAALPMLVVNPKVDWSAFTEAPYARPEFAIGSALANGNGFDIFWDFTLARWACIPFSLIGGYFCYRWGRELYGVRSGIVALVLWCFCPNILGNGALITPDVPAAALGVTACYFFWRWLKAPGWPAALVAGLTLGLAELTKSTWIILFALYPAMWFVWTVCQRRRNPELVSRQNSQPGDWLSFPRRYWRLPLRLWGPFRQEPGNCACPPSLGGERLSASGQNGRGQNDGDPTDTDSFIADPRSAVRYPRYVAQLAVILTLALYLLNLGYGFENSFQPLGKFAFISRTLGGPEAHEKPGNRFAGTWLASIPVPVPANYLRGIDVQKYDFEKGKWSYLRGEHKFGGWWYYYLYAMAVKMPAGTLALIGIACVFPLAGLRRQPACESADNSNNRSASRRSAIRGPESAIVLLLPAFVVLIVISSQTGFSRYLRYALPAFPFLFLFASGLIGAIPQMRNGAQGGSLRIRGALAHAATPLLLLASATSSLAVFPHSLSYFNEVAGGPLNGANHLLDANVDWGQDLLTLRRWCGEHAIAFPMGLAYAGHVEPTLTGIAFEDMLLTRADSQLSGRAHAPGWCAVGLNEIGGYKDRSQPTNPFRALQNRSPTSRAGYSIRIFHRVQGIDGRFLCPARSIASVVPIGTF